MPNTNPLCQTTDAVVGPSLYGDDGAMTRSSVKLLSYYAMHFRLAMMRQQPMALVRMRARVLHGRNEAPTGRFRVTYALLRRRVNDADPERLGVDREALTEKKVQPSRVSSEVTWTFLNIVLLFLGIPRKQQRTYARDSTQFSTCNGRHDEEQDWQGEAKRGGLGEWCGWEGAVLPGLPAWHGCTVRASTNNCRALLEERHGGQPQDQGARDPDYASQAWRRWGEPRRHAPTCAAHKH
ncbi:hypothetical protein Micbo1qcDRAFT_176837 [Microdochium bolleyi]|uniref:Uncharacterized protein n=1 Tax=Microdochium bolleyi TaxID=196109 RepID=A0A136IZI1_9PEZI|nr:hypothetical protein Micbo1qcDRAFT_176837 [Microdochium bolleyi]